MHELFYRNIEPAYGGRYRDVRVLTAGSQYPVTASKMVQSFLKRGRGHENRGEETGAEECSERRGQSGVVLKTGKTTSEPEDGKIRHRDSLWILCDF